MVYEHTDYRGFIKSVLADRIAKNPKYSLRAMARSFAISPALLSQISNGKRNLTTTNAVRLARKMGLTKREAEYFCSLVQYQDAKHIESKALLLDKINGLRSRREVHNIPLDAFKVLADWYHITIIEMLGMKGFNPTPAHISRRLGISLLEAETALDRLKRLQLIELNADGALVRTHKSRKIESSEKNLALQAFHRQMLEKAAQSLTMQTPKEKFVGSETFAFDVSQMPEVQRRIDEFLDDLSEFAATGANPTETYHAGVQLFRLTRKEET